MKSLKGDALLSVFLKPVFLFTKANGLSRHWARQACIDLCTASIDRIMYVQAVQERRVEREKIFASLKVRAEAEAFERLRSDVRAGR